MLNKMNLVFAGLMLVHSVTGCRPKDSPPSAVVEPEPSPVMPEPSPAPRATDAPIQNPGPPAQQTESVRPTVVSPIFAKEKPVEVRPPAVAPNAAEPSDGGESVRAWIEVLKTKCREIRIVVSPAEKAALRVELDKAVLALGAIGEPAVPVLIGMLGADEWTDEYVAKALGKIGSPAVAPLNKLLSERDKKLVAGVVTALGEIGPDAKTAVTDLIDLMKRDPGNFELSFALERALGKIGKPAVTPLVGVLRDGIRRSDGVLLLAATKALAEIGPDAEPAVPQLIEIFQNGGFALRSDAAKALGKIGPGAAGALPVLLRGTRDDNMFVRKEVALAIGGMGKDSDKVIAPLIDLLGDGEVDVRRAASEGLAKVGKKAVPAVVKAFQSRDTDVRAGAAITIGNMIYSGTAAGDVKESVPGLIELLKDRNATVRSWAAYSIGMIGGIAREAVGPLTELLKDSSPEVRKDAATALGRMGPAAKDVVANLKPLLKDDTESVRKAATEALKLVDPSEEKVEGIK